MNISLNFKYCFSELCAFKNVYELHKHDCKLNLETSEMSAFSKMDVITTVNMGSEKKKKIGQTNLGIFFDRINKMILLLFHPQVVSNSLQVHVL